MRPDHPARLYHYTHSELVAKTIAQTGQLRPGRQEAPAGLGFPERYTEPRVNLTSIPPERGADTVKVGTGIVWTPEYALEVVIDQERYALSRSFADQFPRSYQIFTDDPVDVVVKNIWNVRRNHHRAQRGRSVRRYGSDLAYFSFQT